MTKNEEVKGIALLSLLVIAMAIIPYTGYISYGGVNITTIHIVVAIASIVYGKKGAIATGTVWGIMSYVRAWIYADSSAPIFLDPLVSIMPRVLLGIFVGILADSIRGKVDIKFFTITCAVATSLTNTVLVVLAMGLFAKDAMATFGYTISAIYEVVLSVNAATELTMVVILTPIIVQQIHQANPILGYEKESVAKNEFDNQIEN